MASTVSVTSLQSELNTLLGTLQQIKKGSEDLHALMERLRQDMEIPTQPSFRSGIASPTKSVSSGMAWRNGVGSIQSKSQTPSYTTSKSHQSPLTSLSSGGGGTGRYVSKFVSTGSIDNKILTTVIGNKLNAFTPLTYNDIRDFIYQILDSGETEFIKDFIERVFAKATLEDLYCGLFAKLIAEIAHKYPIMYDEMKRYHKEFMKIFNDAGDGDHMKRMYRLGYGQFLSELASLNTLEKEHLLEIVLMINQKIWDFTAMADKEKLVEELIDCLVRLSLSLKERSPKFFNSVKGEISTCMIPNIKALLGKTAGHRPSLTSKARFGLMDLQDLL